MGQTIRSAGMVAEIIVWSEFCVPAKSASKKVAPRANNASIRVDSWL